MRLKIKLGPKLTKSESPNQDSYQSWPTSVSSKADNIEKCWILKKSGLGLKYLNQMTGKPASDVVVNIRSIIWPGSHIFYKDGFQFRVYIGDGLKYEPSAYYPSFNHVIVPDVEDPEVIYEYKSAEKKPQEDLNAEGGQSPDQDTDE